MKKQLLATAMLVAAGFSTNSFATQSLPSELANCHFEQRDVHPIAITIDKAVLAKMPVGSDLGSGMLMNYRTTCVGKNVQQYTIATYYYQYNGQTSSEVVPTNIKGLGIKLYESHTYRSTDPENMTNIEPAPGMGYLIGKGMSYQWNQMAPSSKGVAGDMDAYTKIIATLVKTDNGLSDSELTTKTFVTEPWDIRLAVVNSTLQPQSQFDPGSSFFNRAISFQITENKGPLSHAARQQHPCQSGAHAQACQRVHNVIAHRH